MTTIYIVYGSTGEYSDRHEWAVEARTTEEAAIARVKRLDELMREVGASGEYMGWEKERAAIAAMKTHPEGDPHFSLDYTGTSYSYGPCELVP